ncbi:hypothetical protein [Aquimarina megaterium]|uniref:hypothetical protein n=1 Tax=Aquimarina megaterium TaxID=1443666 RepID=UPI000944438D|nr:hypothetical protein [Aquimarina megaterium]
MNQFKSILIVILVLFSVKASAQKIPDGLYFVTGNKINQIKILNRRDGSIKATFDTYRGTVEIAFSLLKNIPGSYESVDTKENYILTKKNNLLTLLVLGDMNLVIKKEVLAISKKELKAAKKQLGIKSELSKELGSLWGKKQKKEEEEEKGPLEYFVKDATSDFHQKNVGKIVFFSKEPTVGNEDMSTIKTDFKIGDEIWGVAYFPAKMKDSYYLKRLSNHFQDNFGRNHYWITIGMDKMEKDLLPKENEVVNQCTVKRLKKTDLEKNYAVFQIVPSSVASMKIDRDGASFLLGRMGERLDPYKHNLRISLTDGKMDQEDELYFGTITYDTTEGTEDLIMMAKEIEEGALKAKRAPTPVMRNANLEAEMMQQIELWANTKDWPGVKFHKVMITLDWQILKDDYGNIKGNYVEGDVLYSDDEGCGYRNFGFLKTYLGNGQYDENIKQHTIGHRGELSCDKVK